MPTTPPMAPRTPPIMQKIMHDNQTGAFPKSWSDPEQCCRQPKNLCKSKGQEQRSRCQKSRNKPGRTITSWVLNLNPFAVTETLKTLNKQPSSLVTDQCTFQINQCRACVARCALALSRTLTSEVVVQGAKRDKPMMLPSYRTIAWCLFQNRRRRGLT